MKSNQLIWFAAALVFSPMAGHAAEPKTSSAKIGQYDGHVLTDADMRKDIPMDLYQAESDLYDVKKGWIEKQAKNAFFDQAAKEAKLSRKDWEKREIDDRVKAPSQEEIQQFLKHNYPPSESSKPEAVKEVTDYLGKQKHDARETEIYQKLLKKHHLEIRVAKPVAPHINVEFRPDDPAKGPVSASVTVLEFT